MSRIQTAFAIAYGRDPTSEEMARMSAVGVPEDRDWPALLRRIIAIHERALYPTALSSRFGNADLEYFPIEGFEIALDLGDQSVSVPVKRDREFEPEVTNFLKRTLRTGMTFFDVGANIGFFSLLASRIVGPTGSVQAFEPNSENCRLILLSRERNGFKQLNVNAVALGREQTSAFFSPALGSNGGMLPNTVNQLVNPQCVVVPVFRLDDMSGRRRVDVIKMDVEGAEAAILEGAPNIMNVHRPIICTEFQVGMLTHVSGVDPATYLHNIQRSGYKISRLDRAADAEIPITDTDHFLSFEAGPISRLHELVFRPF